MYKLLAQVTPIAPATSYPAGVGGVAFLQNFLSAFLIMSFILGIVAFLFFLLSGGIDWITSGGDKANTEKAKNKISNALIGLFILLSLYAFIDLFVGRIFNLNLLSFHIGQLNVSFGSPPAPPTVGPVPLPTLPLSQIDLQPTDLRRTATGNIQVFVCNNGSVGGSTSYRIVYGLLTGSQPFYETRNNPIPAAGSCVWMPELDCNFISACQFSSLHVLVDSADNVVETDEGNNGYSEDL